jgi:acyl-CoA synthetase (AMP-forming)/AMP-acid ligase II
MARHGLVDSVSRFLSLVDTTPDAPVCTWIGDEGQEVETLAFATLAAQAGAIAGALRGRGLVPGDRVLILMQPGLDFVRAFCACLLGRLVPVPAYPHSAAELGRLYGIVVNAGPRAVLSDAMLLRAMRAATEAGRSAWPDLYDIAELLAEHAPPPAWEVPMPGDLAFLQYTSGSTSEPKGVRITHGNLSHQLECNRQELGLGPDTRALLWVPQYHDLGLISGLVSALIGNGRLYQMSPLTFVRKPSLWLELASRLRATHIAAPNFAYGLVLRKTTPEEIAGLSLQSLRVVMSAAEPINPRLMHAFFNTFARAGLRSDAFCGAYGLAEHTVGISVGGCKALWLDEEAFSMGIVSVVEENRGVGISSCGKPSRDVHVRIVEPETRSPLPEDRVGEIWVDSPSKADGYYNNPELTVSAFNARSAEASDDRKYLRTGDLGFIHGGELFVTGRLKDMMIFRGRNVYPTDVEQTVEAAHAAVMPRGSVAFSVPGDRGEEALVVVAEVGGTGSATDTAEIRTAISQAVLHYHRQPCAAVVLVKPATIPRTSSGKLRRRDTRQAFLTGSIAAAVASADR